MLLELSLLFLVTKEVILGVGCYHWNASCWSHRAVFPINLPPYILWALNLVCLISSSLCCSFFFFFCLFLCLKKIFFLAYFFLSDGGGLGRRKPLSINRLFHQVFLNYHVGSQPLLCKLYFKKKSFQCRNPPWDCNQLSVLFSLKKDRPLGTALLRTLRKAKVAASCNSMI